MEKLVEKNKWIELIRVRSSAGRVAEAIPELKELIKDIEESEVQAETSLMQHGLYEGDFAAVIVWGNGTPQRTQSGLMLVERMQELGSIEHAVWIPASKNGSYSLKKM